MHIHLQLYPTALQAVTAAESKKEATQKSLLAFCMVVWMAHFKKLPLAQARKLADQLYEDAGRPRSVRQLKKMLDDGSLVTNSDWWVDIDARSISNPDLRKLGKAIEKIDELNDRYWQYVARHAPLITNPAVVSLWKPEPTKPGSIKDPKERQKLMGQYLKDKLIVLVRDGGNAASILKTLDLESGTTDFSRIFPRDMVGHISITENGLVRYDGQPLASHGGTDTTIWSLRGVKAQLPQRDHASYVFQYVPRQGNSIQKVYRKERAKESRIKMWKVVDRLIVKLPTIKKAWLALLKRGDALGAVLHLAYLTSGRIGTPGNKTFGISTLLASHFKWKGQSLIITYPGKGQAGKDVMQEHRIEPNAETKELLNYVRERLVVATKDQVVFADDNGDPLSNSRINQWLQQFVPGLTVHKFRKLRGTSLAKEVLEELVIKPGTSQSAAQTMFKAAMEKVAKALGHYNIRSDVVKVSAATAIKHYIDPSLSRGWFKTNKLEAPKWLPDM